MLPVAFEALSVKTPHSGKSANPKSEPGSSSQFSDMVDVSNNTDTKPPQTGAANRSSGEIASTGKPSASARSAAAVSGKETTLAVVALPSVDEAGGFDQNGQAPEAKGKDATQAKAGAKIVSGAPTKVSAVDGDEDTSDNPGTATPADIIGLTDPLTNPQASKIATVAPTGVHNDKTEQPATDPDSAEGNQADTGTQAAAGSPDASQPITAAVIPVVDAATSTNEVAAQTETAASFGTPDTTTSKGTTASAGTTGPQAAEHSESKNAAAAELAVNSTDLNTDPELPTDMPAFSQLAQRHDKAAQPGSAKLNDGSKRQADASKSDDAVAAQNPAATAHSQPVIASTGSAEARPSEADPQKPASPRHDLLPQDAPAAKNSNASFSSTLSLNGININIAAPAPLHDSASAAAIGTPPQSAPAALVPVSGIAVEIASKALDGKNRFEIRLDPPELGRIHVRLDVDSSGQISSHVVADRSDTLDLLRRDAPALERALNDAGLKTSNNGLQFSLRDHGFSRQDQPLPMPTNTRLIASDEALPAETTPLAYRPLAGLRSGLDIRV